MKVAYGSFVILNKLISVSLPQHCNNSENHDSPVGYCVQGYKAEASYGNQSPLHEKSHQQKRVQNQKSLDMRVVCIDKTTSCTFLE